MGLLNKKNITNIDKDIDTWPNPYHITLNDIKRSCLREYPIEIITLALYYCKKLKGKDFDLKRLKSSDINGGFNWVSSEEGHNFWAEIYYRKDFDEFYDMYTPEKLRKRLEE